MDFTFKTYEKLLNSLFTRGFSFITFAQYIAQKAKVEVKPDSPSQPQPSSNLKPKPLNAERHTPNTEHRTHQQINKSTNFTLSEVEVQQRTNQQINNLIILRHDVEARYPNALHMAQIEHKLGIKGSYYFRIFPKPGNEAIIKQIAARDCSKNCVKVKNVKH